MNNNRSGGSWNVGAGTLARGLVIALMALALSGLASAQDDTALKFNGGIGVIPVTGVSAATGAVNLNVIRGVNPAVTKSQSLPQKANSL